MSDLTFQSDRMGQFLWYFQNWQTFFHFITPIPSVLTKKRYYMGQKENFCPIYFLSNCVTTFLRLNFHLEQPRKVDSDSQKKKKKKCSFVTIYPD